ncbi:uncharacterized protein CCR75_008837 [Bremia lactucae]|uniref:Uncharacterized protein n=1 Tax=Bremia lactucae TaxID=4779 RepID=A0A976IC10_BRELC|nr:hypothetical protein CCR75_008837 [Bremia lactucae]
MTSSKHEEVAALEALRDSSAELVRYLENINRMLLHMNQQNESASSGRKIEHVGQANIWCPSLHVLENWSSVIAISKVGSESNALALAGKLNPEKNLIRASP